MKYRSKYSLIIFSLSSLLLTGCLHKNPLLNEDMISFMRSNFMNDSPDFSIKECSLFYANRVNNNLKNKCDEWTKNYYRLLINSDSIPASSKLDDLRDANFWKQVILTED